MLVNGVTGSRVVVSVAMIIRAVAPSPDHAHLQDDTYGILLPAWV